MRCSLRGTSLKTERGFDIFRMDDSEVSRNRAIGNSRDGFNLVDADSVALIKNIVTRNDGDGIDVDSTDVDDTVIDGNRILRNRGTGIEDDADDGETDIKNNVIKGNHTDIAGRGDSCGNPSATDGGSNVFVTGGFKVCTPGTGDE